MKIIYEIKTGANPENPNEQLPSTTINDDRLFGKRIYAIGYSGQFYNSEFWSKPIESNKLTLTMPGMNFTHGMIVNLETCD